MIGDGRGRFSFAPFAALPERWGGTLTDGNVVQSADFNGDGWPDLIFHIDQWREGYDIQHVQLMLNNQDGTFRDASANIPQPEKIYLGGNCNRFADFNNDGWLDLMLKGQYQNIQGTSLLYINKGNGVFEDITSIVLGQLTPENNDYWNGKPVDVDNDGDMDFVTARQDNTCIDIYRQQFPYDAGTVPLPWPVAPSLLSPADGGTAPGHGRAAGLGQCGDRLQLPDPGVYPGRFFLACFGPIGCHGQFPEGRQTFREHLLSLAGAGLQHPRAGPWSASRSFSTPSAHTISGQVTYNGLGLPGVVLEGLPGNPQTDATGHYSARVENGWSGTACPPTQATILPPRRPSTPPWAPTSPPLIPLQRPALAGAGGLDRFLSSHGR